MGSRLAAGDFDGTLIHSYLEAMATTKAKSSSRVKPTTRRKTQARSKPKGYSEPYHAKKYAGAVPAFANVVAEEMKAWRDDR